MKKLMLLLALPLIAGAPEVIELTPSETAHIKALHQSFDAAWAAVNKVQEDMCNAEKQVKAHHQAFGATIVSCGTASAGGIVTGSGYIMGSGNLISSYPRIQWEFSQDYKFLVKTER